MLCGLTAYVNSNYCLSWAEEVPHTADKSVQEILLHRSDKDFPEFAGMRTSSAPSAREGDYDKHDGKSVNRTRLVGSLWISNSRLLCLVMALDLMTMTVQVRRREL